MAYIQLVKDTRSFHGASTPVALRGPSPEGRPHRKLGANQIHHRKPRLVIRLMGPISEMFWLVVEPYPSEKYESQLGSLFPIPYAPCMVYLPTFGWFLGQMLVNIPYMEHMGIYGKIKMFQWFSFTPWNTKKRSLELHPPNQPLGYPSYTTM